MKKNRRMLSVLLTLVLAMGAFITPAAAEQEVDPAQLCDQASIDFWNPSSSSQRLTVPAPHGGTLISNVWRQWGHGTVHGNMLQWRFQVSTVYEGTAPVARIRATWQAGASLRNGASVSLGVGKTGISIGGSQEWQTIWTPAQWWENSNGAKSAHWNSNILIGPEVDYRRGTIMTTNQALVQFHGDPRVWQISAGV